MKLARFISPIIVLAISIAVASILIATAPDAERRVPPPVVPTVKAVPLRAQEYPVTIMTRGTVSPRTQSTLIPEVAGRITSISPNFRSGGFFEVGDVLLTIDPRDYKNTVTVMRAELAQAQLALHEEQARVEQARINWERLGDGEKPGDLVLRKPQLVSKQAAAAAAQARLDQAEIDLERTRIKAPYVGRILEKLVDVGQYVSSGTVLASIYAIDYVEIRLPLTDQQIAFIDLPETYRSEPIADVSFAILKETTTPAVTVSARIGQHTHHWTGKIVRTEGSIDTRSRQLFVVGQIDDPYAHHEQRPPLKVGQFVKAEIQGIILQDVFVIPPAAIQVGDEVWLVDKDQRLERRKVQVIWRNAEQLVVEKGLHSGERLVITPLPYGVPGTRVRITAE